MPSFLVVFMFHKMSCQIQHVFWILHFYCFLVILKTQKFQFRTQYQIYLNPFIWKKKSSHSNNVLRGTWHGKQSVEPTLSHTNCGLGGGSKDPNEISLYYKILSQSYHSNPLIWPSSLTNLKYFLLFQSNSQAGVKPMRFMTWRGWLRVMGLDWSQEGASEAPHNVSQFANLINCHEWSWSTCATSS